MYGLQILDATLEAGNTEEEDTSALLLKHEFLDGGADDVTLATLGEVLLEPTLTTLGIFLVRSNSQSSLASASFAVGGFQLEGYAMTLSLEHRAHLQLGDVRQRGQRLRGRHRHLPRHGLAGRLEHGAPGLLGAAGRNREAALRSLRRLYPRAGAAVGGHAGPVQHADQEGESVSVTDLLADSLALTGSATLDGLTTQGNVGCDQQLCNDVNCTDVFTTGVDASGTISCTAGTVAGAARAVSGSSLSISGGPASVGQEVGVCRPPGIPGTLRKLLFGAKLNGGAEGPGRRLQREGPAEAVPTCEAARPRRMAFEALKADVGRQVQAPRPHTLGKPAAEGPNDRLQADLIDFSQNTWGKTKYGLVVMDVFTREAAVEPLQNKNAETAGRATKRAARELTGDDGNFVDDGPGQRVRHAGPGAACGSRAPHEAAEDRFAIAVVDRGIQTLKKDLATRVARKGGSGATTLSGRPGPTTRGPARRCTARPRMWRSSRPRSSGSSKTTPTSSSTTRTSPTGA